MNRWLRATLLLVLASAPVTGGVASPVIAEVSTSGGSFNPSAAEAVQIDVVLGRAGTLDVRVIDRDGYPARTLAASAHGVAGRNSCSWDGRGDDGRVVADEAYSLVIDWTEGGRKERYFPAAKAAKMVSIPVRYYSRQAGVITYDLPVASRVHLQAGVAALNAKTRQMEGPVLKTIVDREPRSAGRIAEQWNGMDQTGAFFVADLRNFVIAVAATPLPENAIIAYGNRERTFLDVAAARQGPSLLAGVTAAHAHHKGLTAMQDVSPPLKVEPLNAAWSAADKTWILAGPTLRLRVMPEGPAARAFAAQPAKLYHFVDAQLVSQSVPRGGAAIIEIPAARFRGDGSTVSLNWRSEYGPVAVSSLRVRTVSQPEGAGQ